MDRCVSPRVAYWTSSFEPEMEGVALEVATLRRQFPGSVAWGLSDRRWVLLSKARGCGFNPRLHLLFRAVTRLFEPMFDLNHIFGRLGDWFYLQGMRRRPTILTVTTPSVPVEKRLLDRVEQFVVEHPSAREDLRWAGIDDGRIKLIYPPVDLRRFSPQKPPAAPFTVLFASSTEEVSWLEARGVPQILDAAMLRPEMRFRLLWRPWGDSEATVRRWIGERGLRNVDLVVGCSDDMPAEYNNTHVTVAPFTDPARSKAAPNSIIESLACGRPVLVTKAVGLAELIVEARAGVVCAPAGDSIADNLDRLAADWELYSSAAGAVAEKHFSLAEFLTQYRRLYQGVLTG